MEEALVCECGEFECLCEHEEVSDSELVELSYDDDLFNEGVASVSHLLGQIFGLKQLGMSHEEIIQLLTLQNSITLERETQAHERELAKINSEATIKCEEIKRETSLEMSLMNN